MSSDIAIQVEGVGKRFRLRHAGTRTLKSVVLDVFRRGDRTARDLWALKDIGFTVARGKTLGLIGANGAGKSTLLALLAGTLEPTEGRIVMKGTISSLLELGAGFHPDLTGRENVFLAGAIMGLTRNQMKKRFDAIVEFADIGRFIDQPVKHYSSGMYVRLGFAVAVEVDPDILLVDEVLAVGDSVFQRKCLKRMAEFRRQNKTMLIISHDLNTIQSVSDEILFLDHGRILGHGTPEAVIGQYESFSRGITTSDLKREWGTREVVLTGAEFYGADGREAAKFKWGEELNVRLHYDAPLPVGPSVFGFAIADENGRIVNANNTQIEKVEIPGLHGAGSIVLRLPSLNLAQGTYLFSFSVHSADHRVNYHRLDHAFAIGVDAGKRFEGVCYVPCEWHVEKETGGALR
jgi:ABC-type polysaccharide/polyol phosphate transport system ATPase subunit